MINLMTSNTYMINTEYTFLNHATVHLLKVKPNRFSHLILQCWKFCSANAYRVNYQQKYFNLTKFWHDNHLATEEKGGKINIKIVVLYTLLYFGF